MEEEEVLQQEQVTQTDPKKEVKQQTPQEFSAKIKSKYPQYKDMDDVELAQKIVAKYPQYEGVVNFNVKKKDTSESTVPNQKLDSEAKGTDGSLATPQDKDIPVTFGADGLEQTSFLDKEKRNEQFADTVNASIPKEEKPKETKSYGWELGKSLEKGSARLGEMFAATPEFIYDIFSIPQNVLSDPSNYPLGLAPYMRELGVEKLATDSDKLKDQVGVENKIKDFYSTRVEELTKEQEELGRKYEGTITENFQNGNIEDGFRMLGNAITESMPVSLSIMAGGAAVNTPKLLMGTTVLTGAGENEQYKKDNPEMDATERTVNSLGKGFAEGVFSTIGTGTIGVAAKEIIAREGVEQGSQILKQNIINIYKEALKKYPIPAAMLGEGLEEAATQMTQNAIDGKPVMDGVSDAFLIGMGSGGAFGTAIKGLKVATKDKSTKDIVKTLDENNLDSEKVKTELEMQVNEGDLKPKEASEIYENFEEVREQLKAVPEDYNTEEKTKAVELLKQRSELEKKIEGKDPALVETEKARIEEINNELKSIKNPNAQKQESTQEETKSEVLPTKNEEVQTEVNKRGNLENKTYTTKSGEVFNIEIYDAENGKVDSVEDRKRTDRFSLAVTNDNGETVGRLGLWQKEDGNWFANLVDVYEEYQRKGIATAMYDYAEANGFNIVDSENQTEAGKAFKENRKKEKSNETTQTENTPTNEGTESNIDIQEQGVQSKPSEEVTTFETKGGYTVTKNKDNSLSVVDKKGKEPSAPTKRKQLKEYAETVDFTQGEKYKPQGNVSESSGIDIDNEVATNSKNPAELAEVALRTSTKQFIEDNVDQDAVNIIEYIAKRVKRGKKNGGNDGSFSNVSDTNNITNALARTYFSKKGDEGVGLDVLAQEVSEEFGKDFTEQDLVDYMLMYPNGISDIEKSVRDKYSNPAKQSFSEITGFPASDYYLKKAVEQAKKKEKLDDVEQNTYLDSLTEEELVNLHKEREQYEKTIEQGTEGVSEIGNTTDSQEQSRVQEGTNKTDGEQKTEQGEVNLSESLKINDFISNLDQAIDKLDQFGKETLGMNLPVAVAKKALQAMKLASLTAKTVADITSAGINAVKETNWYQNLSNKEQSDIESNFLDYINKPFTKNNPDKTRATIEQEVDEFISQGLSESEVLEQFETRREKMIAKDHITRKKQATPQEAKKIVDGAYANSEAEMNKKSNIDSVSKMFRNFAQKIWDRQFLPKFLLMKSGGKLVRNYIVASKGASGYAKLLYDEAHDKIYKGLSSKEIELLDKIIMLRRFIAIDNNRADQDKPAVVHQDYINKDTAETYLSELESELGKDAYNDLNKRADDYFDTFRGLLDSMQESGLISKATRDSFFDIDYQPREFLQFLKDSEGEISINEQGNKNSSKGLANKQIQKLEDGLDTALIWDSQYLLSRAVNVRTQSIAMNNANKKFADFMAEQKKVVDELKQKDNPTKKEKKTIKYFDELSKNVKLNPIIGFNDNGDPKYMISKTPQGFSNAYYYVNGVKHNLLMADAFYDQYYDNIKGIFKNNNVKEKAALASGTALVKGLATGNNPTFFLSNSPRDLMFIATFSDTYGWSVPRNIAQLLKDTTKGVIDIKKGNDNFKNFVKYGGMMDFLHKQGRFKGTNAIRKLIDSKINNKSQEKIGNVFKWATLQKLQMYSEIGFRMAVFNRSVKQQVKDLGFKSIDEITDKNTVDDIYTNAVASARNTTDFNQGGTVIKDADAFIPYLNASTQGTKVMLDNLRERPVETTFRMAQSAAIISSIPISMSVALISAFRGDDEPEEDKDKSALELYLKARKGLSKYEKVNYMTFFTGKRDAEGEFEYVRIAKPHGLTPMISLAENLQQEIIKNQVGDESSNNMIEEIGFALNNNVSPLEFGITDNFARVPLLKAAMTYTTGYDFFREKDLSYKRGTVPVQAEGYENPSVEDFYKKIGDHTNVSPVRMKGAVESFITSPSTTPYVGVLYGGLDALMSDKDGSEVVEKLGKDILKSTKNRLHKTTSDYNRRMDNNNRIKEKIDKLKTEDIKSKNEFRTTVKKYIDGDITDKQLEKTIMDAYEKSPFDAKRMINKAKDMIKHKDVNPYVFEIKYSEPKVRAIMLADMFGDDLLDEKKGNLKLKQQLVKYKAINKETIYEYKKLIEE